MSKLIKGSLDKIQDIEKYCHFMLGMKADESASYEMLH